jgi:hypothetical protein
VNSSAAGKTCGFVVLGWKNAKKYVLATDATDIFHTSCM